MIFLFIKEQLELSFQFVFLLYASYFLFLQLNEEEYEKNQLKEKLDDEVWEDLEFDDESQAQSLDMNNQLYEIDPNSNNV